MNRRETRCRPQAASRSVQRAACSRAFRVCSVWLAACSVLLSGCIHRKLTIITTPPGASVYVNDKLKGVTPLSYDFTWYGWHRITVRKDGYDRLEDRKLLRAPVYLWIPFDLVMEGLPFPIRDERTWTYTLTPQGEPVAPEAPSEELTIPAAQPAEAPSATGATHDAR